MIAVPHPQQGAAGQVRGVLGLCDRVVLSALRAESEPVSGLDSPARRIAAAPVGGRRGNGGRPGPRRVGDAALLRLTLRPHGGEATFQYLLAGMVTKCGQN